MVDDSFAQIFADTCALYPGLDGGRLLPTHQAVGHVAHGWYMRTKRSCQAVLALVEAGYAAEAWPMRRAAHEHLIALLWLQGVGREAKDPLRRQHGYAAQKRHDAVIAAGLDARDLAVWGLVQQDRAEATGSSASDVSLHMEERIKRYGRISDLVAWRTESAHSHPNWETASAYLQEDSPQLLPDPRWDASLNDEEHCAFRLVRAYTALSLMVEDQDWRDKASALVSRFDRVGSTRTHRGSP